MLLNGYDLGKCGIEQVLCAGKVSFDTKDVSKGIVLIELPQNIIITKAVAVVNTAFNAATTNVLTVGSGCWLLRIQRTHFILYWWEARLQ